MYGPEFCIPVHLSPDDDPRVAARLGSVLAERHAADCFIQIVAAAGTGTLDATRELLRALGGHFTVGLEASPETLVEAATADIAPHFVTVRLGCEIPLRELRALVSLLQQSTERVIDVSAPTAAQAMCETLQSFGYFRVFVPGSEDDPLRMRSDAHLDGRGFLHVAGGSSQISVLDGGVEAAARSRGESLHLFRLVSPLQLPAAFRVPEPDGEGAVSYWCGGTQAFAVYWAAEESRASLGFRSTEMEEFAALLGGDAHLAEGGLFPAFEWDWPDLALVPGRPMPPREAGSERCVFAAALAQGFIDRVGFALGLLHELPGAEPKPNLAHLDDGLLKAALDRADTRWCTTLALLARSRAAERTRQRALLALEEASTSTAKRSLEYLARRDVADARAAVKRWSRAHAQKKRERRSNDDQQARLKFLRDSIEAFKTGTRRAP